MEHNGTGLAMGLRIDSWSYVMNPRGFIKLLFAFVHIQNSL